MVTTTKTPVKMQQGLNANSFRDRSAGKQVTTNDDPDLGPDTDYQNPALRYPPSARRYDTSLASLPPGTYNIVIPRRRSRQQQYQQPQHPQEAEQQRGGFHWLVYVGVAMLLMVIGWVVFNAALTWWQVTQDDLHYGRPRTFQTNAVVGHNDSSANPSHFIALNLNRHVEIIEFPGGDPTHARIFLGPILIGDGEDLTPITLSFKDVNGDGKPDLLVHMQDQTIVFINDNGTFRPAKPGETVHL